MPTVDARLWAEGFGLGLQVLNQQQVLEAASGQSGVCHIHARGPYPHAHHHPVIVVGNYAMVDGWFGLQSND